MGAQTLSSSDKEIGGDFSITSSIIEGRPVYNYFQRKEGIHFLSTCRSAITEIINVVKPANNKLALVPSFTCHVCVEPFVKAGYEVFPYSIETNLSVIWDKLLEDADRLKPSIILIHSYFGINTLTGNEDVIREMQNRRIVIVEDLTHGMFSSFKRLKADYFIGSIRKWFPVPDGAFVKGLKTEENDYCEDSELVKKKLNALLMKGSFMERATQDNSGYRQLGAEAEQFLDTRENTYRMSDVSKNICNTFDITVIKKQRRDNYNYLFNTIRDSLEIHPVFNRCSKENESPYMFPVYVEEGRSEFQKYMVSHKIFPTIIWGCPEGLFLKIDDVAQYIYDHIICFHCDHRYTMSDMKKIASLTLNYKRI